MENCSNKMFKQLRLEMARHTRSKTAPFLTISFAQSLDGCLSTKAGQATALSCRDTLIMTHQLRAMHKAILVGIDTVLSDNPRLTVRFAEGPNPRPIILDSRLRTPLDCNLVRESAESLIIFTSDHADAKRQQCLEALGIQVFRLPFQTSGLSLSGMMVTLEELAIQSIMIEGGGKVISSFLEQGFVDFIVITIAPVLLGTQEAIRYQLPTFGAAIDDSQVFRLGQDMVAWGQPVWQKPSKTQDNLSLERGPRL